MPTFNSFDDLGKTKSWLLPLFVGIEAPEAHFTGPKPAWYGGAQTTTTGRRADGVLKV